MNRFWSAPFSRLVQREGQTTDEGMFLEGNGSEDVELTPFDIRLRRFGRRLFGGVNPEEVTAFLGEVAEALFTAQSRQIQLATQVTALEREIEELKYASVASPDEVPGSERRAGSIVRDDEANERASTASRLELLRTTALQEVEALLHDAQVQAQTFTGAANERAAAILREADALKSQRQAEAEQCVAEATASAESILSAARDQETSLRRDLDRLAESRLRMLDDLWATLDGFQAWLGTVDPRQQRPKKQDGLDRVA